MFPGKSSVKQWYVFRIGFLDLFPHDRETRPEDVLYATKETLVFAPLPCWSHLSPEQYRQRVLSLVEEIEEETALRRSRTGARPLGRDAVLAQDPHHRPAKIKRSPAPFVHAVSKAVRRQLWEAYSLVVAAYRTAADRLRAGDRDAVFPLGCFPPALPFVGG
jgi:hypothetical protein